MDTLKSFKYEEERSKMFLPSFLQGFPTIYWLPKNSKKPVSYGAGRELDDFVKYIAKEASEELKGFDRSGKAKKVEL